MDDQEKKEVNQDNDFIGCGVVVVLVALLHLIQCFNDPADWWETMTQTRLRRVSLLLTFVVPVPAFIYGFRCGIEESEGNKWKGFGYALFYACAWTLGVYYGFLLLTIGLKALINRLVELVDWIDKG